MSDRLSDKEIIAAYDSKKLLDDIFQHSSFGADSEPLRNACTVLHNAKEINLLSLTEGSEFEAISPQRFFAGQHFYCDVIPSLDASITEMMRCVHALVKKGGEDLAANQPNAAFKTWCERDLSRAREVIDAAQGEDQLASEHLTFALIAGNFVEEAKHFVEGYSDRRRLSGIAGLGRMTFPDTQSARDALATLLLVLDSTEEDVLFANILLSAFDIKGKTPDLGYQELVSIAERVCAVGGPQVNLACARILFAHAKALSKEVLALLLRPLTSLDVSHEVTIEVLDVGLATLLDTSHADQAIEFLAELLPSGLDLTLEDFPSFGSALLRAPNRLFQKVLVAWMLSGKHVLCEGVSSLLRGRQQSEQPLDLAISDSSLSPDQQAFICRKAIGYFFLQPVVAGSIIVSVLRTCDDSVVEFARTLLFDPLLRNYGGKIKEYLCGIAAIDPAYHHVQLPLKEAEQYLDSIRAVGNVKELHPSESQRQTVRVRDRDEMRKAHKQAMNQSVLLSLVSRSVILHGRRTVTFVEEPGKKRRPMEMDLKSHSIEFELPRTEIIDPIGLDLMLRVFRAERPTA